MVHPKTAKMYADAGMSVPPKTEDEVRANFDRVTKGQPKKYKIDQIYRVKRADRDYIVYNQTIISEDFPGNERTCSETVGYHDEPRFHKTYDPESGEPRATAVSGNEVVYDIPATKQNILKILEGPDVIPTNTNFVLDNGGTKHGGWTKDEFVNKHFDDLLYKVTNGYYPKQAKPFGGEEGGIKQLKKDLVTTEESTPQSGAELAVMEGSVEEEKSQEEELKEEQKEQEKLRREQERTAEKTKREEEKKRREEVKYKERLEREQEKQDRKERKDTTTAVEKHNKPTTRV